MKVMAVLILPVLHRPVALLLTPVVPVDRYYRCLGLLYHSRLGPVVVPALYLSTTGLGSVVERLLGACGPVLSVNSCLTGTTGATGGCTA